MPPVTFEVPTVGHDEHAGGPVEQSAGEAGDVLTPAEHDHRLVARLVTITTRAVKDRAAIEVEEPGHVGELVPNAGREHDPTGVDLGAVLNSKREHPLDGTLGGGRVQVADLDR